MINGIVFPHVPAFGRGVDLVVELVSPGSNNLLHVVVSELAVVDHIVAKVKGIHLIRRSLLNHYRAGDLPTRIFLPDRNVGAVRDSCLNRPLIVDFRRREDSLLTVRIEAVKNGVTRHQIVRRQLRFNVRLGNDTTNADVHPLKDVRNVQIQIDHRHIEPVIAVVFQ